MTDGKWQAVTLKNRWYDDHVGFDPAPQEQQNKLLGDDAGAALGEQQLASAEVERFFDLFERPS